MADRMMSAGHPGHSAREGFCGAMLQSVFPRTLKIPDGCAGRVSVKCRHRSDRIRLRSHDRIRVRETIKLSVYGLRYALIRIY